MLIRVYYTLMKVLLNLVLSVLALVAPMANSCKCAVSCEPPGRSDGVAAHTSCHHSCHDHSDAADAESHSGAPSPDECPQDWRCERQPFMVLHDAVHDAVDLPMPYVAEWHWAALRCNSNMSDDSRSQLETHPPPRSPPYLRFGRMLI
jgi:hypothetical protein